MRINGNRQGNITSSVRKHAEKFIPGSRALQTAAWSLNRKGICAAMSAYYLKNKVKDAGNFWEWIDDYDHKFEVMAPYLGENFQLLSPLEASGNIHKFLCRHFEEAEGGRKLAGPDFTAVNFYLALVKSRDLGLARYCRFSHSTADRAHAVAFAYYTKPMLLDPNYHELVFDNDAELYDWCRVFWSLYNNFDTLDVFYFR